MHLAVQTFTLHIPGAASLKDKRQVVKSLKDRIRKHFNASVLEYGSLDLHRTAQLAVAVLSDGRGAADRLLDGVDQLIESDGRALIQDTHREFR